MKMLEFMEALGQVGFEAGWGLESATETEMVFDDSGRFRSVKAIRTTEDHKIVVVLGDADG
ncbi:MAG: hypothetical protein M0Z95_11935 [Actinomycetota bacterium]|nr:hypothetical protein [Actinomycetota bacterium]